MIGMERESVSICYTSNENGKYNSLMGQGLSEVVPEYLFDEAVDGLWESEGIVTRRGECIWSDLFDGTVRNTGDT